jgi:uncharacterized protein YehS (DUF1456 family)
MTKIEEINQFMLEQFEENGFEDTPENRLAFLQGLQQAWKEDQDVSLEKTLYQIALNGEIMIIQMRIGFSTLR